MLPLLAALPLLLQEPPPPAAAPAPAQESALQVLQRTWREAGEAAGIRLRMTQTVVNGSGEMRMTLHNHAEGTLVRPASGTLQVRGEVEPPGGGREQMPPVDLLGTGDGIYAADHGAQALVNAGDDWASAGVGFLEPLAAWSGAPAPAPEDACFLPAVAGREGWTGIAYTWMEAERTLWVDAEGRWREHSAVLSEDHRFLGTVDVLELLDEVDEAELRATLPTDYGDAVELEERDFERSLLGVGTAAPEVEFLGMDGTRFTLASLRGKTVLLNFWFYH